MQLAQNAMSAEMMVALGAEKAPRPLTPDDKRHLSQSAARIAADLPTDRKAALFLLARASVLHAAILDEGSE